MQSSVVFSSRLWNDEEYQKSIVTPPVGSENEQFLLVPSNGLVRVMSMKNGNFVTNFTPKITNVLSDSSDANCDSPNIKMLALFFLSKNDYNSKSDSLLTVTTNAKEEEKDLEMEDVTDVSSEDEEDDKEVNEWVVLALCQDGATLLEWTLKSILSHQKKKSDIPPRRHFTFDSNVRFIHDITSPNTTGNLPSPMVMYGLSKEKKNEGKTFFFKLTIPTYQEEDGEDSLGSPIRLDRKMENKIVLEHKKYNNPKLLLKHKQLCAPGSSADNNELLFPFQLLSSRHGNYVYVMILNYMGFQLYCEYNLSRDEIQSSHSSPSSKNNLYKLFSFPSFYNHHLRTASAISPNGKDIALGYDNGHMMVLRGILTIATNNLLQKLEDNGNVVEMNPFDDLVKQKIHWHPLPVRSMVYSPSGMNLFSGGEESVLVTWSMDSSSNRPAHTLPRITKGTITSITVNRYANDSMEVVVNGSDSTIQLIHMHDHSIRWKKQGLFIDNYDHNNCISNTHPIVKLDPRTDLPMLTGAPGTIQWFDPNSSTVVGQLEVSPYNRISRKELSDPPLPKPEVTHFVLSASGDDMITVDTMLSENEHIGTPQKINHSNTPGAIASNSFFMSLTTTIKFWRWSSPDLKIKSTKDMPYEMISAMPSPHGLEGKIDSLAISNDGTRACSLSHGDGTFRIWSRQNGSFSKMNKYNKNSNINTSLSRHMPPTWKCLYKVTIPSGYTKPCHEGNTLRRNDNLVSFSSDGSVLAVAHGQDITLWDHSNALLLNTIHSNVKNLLKDIYFLPTANDMLLSASNASFEVLPPSGQAYLGNGKWSYHSSISEKNTLTVSLVAPLPSSKEIAVALTQGLKNKGEISKSIIVLIDAVSGKPKYSMEDEKKIECRWKINGQVTNISEIPKQSNNNNNNSKVWSNIREDNSSRLLVLTDQSEFIVLKMDQQNTDEKNNIFSNKNQVNSKQMITNGIMRNNQNNIPKLQNVNKNNKRSRLNSEESSSIMTDTVSRKKFSSSFGGLENLNPFLPNSNSDEIDTTSSKQIPSSKLPSLSGAFTTNFISRNLKRGRASI